MLFAIVIIMIISVGMAFWSLRQQNKLEEVSRVKKKLMKSKVIYHKDSLDSLGS